jgi:copper(I)-binding protein
MRTLLIAAALVFAACSPAGAHQYKLGELAIGHPWSRPAGVGMTGVGYLTVANAGAKDDVLQRVETPVAEWVEIHEGSVTDGVARMKKMSGLTVPAGGKLTLAPGGNHLMMMKLKQPLAVGDKVPATLFFKRAGRVEVSFAVQAAPPATAPAAEHHH